MGKLCWISAAQNALLIGENYAEIALMFFGTNMITMNRNVLFLTQFGHKLIKFNLLVY